MVPSAKCRIALRSRNRVEKAKDMADIYNVSGQAGAIGPNSKAENNTFVQSVGQVQSIDLAVITDQLKTVRKAMSDRLSPGSTAEQYSQIGRIAEAQLAAEKGDQAGVMQHLKNAGSWAQTVAKEVGAEVIAKLIAHLMGIPG